MGKMVVAGGGMCGMAAAMMLGDDGHEVIVLERDPAPPPPEVELAFGGWERKGVGQFGLAHWLHPRGASIVRDQIPGAHQRLVDNGGYQFNFVDYVRSLNLNAERLDGDERFDLITGRRSTLEWSMAEAADEHPSVTVRRGEAVAGLIADRSDGPPHVTGVRLESGEELAADLVIDATGRRSPTPDWLADIGAKAPLEHAEDSGFAYYGRYYRGDMPVALGPLLAPYGTFSLLTLPADNNTWAVTVYGLSDDKPLRALRDAEIHDRVIRACPLHAHWLDGEPISDMMSMVGVVDRHRQFVVDGQPTATGILTIGDAASCTNPSQGRGITFGLMHAELARECISQHLTDPHELSLAFHERSEAEIRPWHDATTSADQRRVREMRRYREGLEPEPTEEERFVDLMFGAMGRDPVILRGAMEIIGCLALPSEVTSRDGFVQRVLDHADDVDLTPAPGPTRDEVLELVS